MNAAVLHEPEPANAGPQASASAPPAHAQPAYTLPESPFARLRRHRTILIATAVFAVLVFILLTATFYSSVLAGQDLAATRMAGRQISLSQRIARTLLELDAMRASGQPRRMGTLLELRNAAAAFQAGLSTLRGGGPVTSPEGRTVVLEPPASARARDLLERIAAIWTPYQSRLAPLLRDDFTSEQLSEALTYSQANNGALLNAGGELIEELQQLGVARSAQSRQYLTAGAALAFANFAVILLMLLHRLRMAQESSEASGEMTREILANVREGVLMLMPDYTIGTRMSRSAHGMFGRTLHAGDDFFSQLAPLVNEKVRMDARAYVGRLFGPSSPEGLVAETNPLHAIEVQARTRVGQLARRHLSFQFHRMYSGGMVDHLLVTIQDTTARMESERRLQEERARSQKDFAMLLRAFDADPATLREFVQRAEAALLEVNDMIGSTGAAQGEAAIARMLDRAARRVHALARDAAAIGLDSVAGLARQFEGELQRIQVAAGGSAAVTAALQSLPQPLTELLQKIGSLKSLASSQRLVSDAAAGEPINEALVRIAHEAAVASGKEVEPVVRMGSHSDLERPARQLVREIAAQLTRHAVVHDLETPQARAEAGKTRAGKLEVTLSRGETDWTLSVRDDGMGINAARVRQRLVELGWYSAPQLESFDERQIVGHIFKPGFSAAESTTGQPVLGVGLDVVQADVQRLGGRMTVSSVPGQATEFRIRFAA